MNKLIFEVVRDTYNFTLLNSLNVPGLIRKTSQMVGIDPDLSCELSMGSKSLIKVVQTPTSWSDGYSKMQVIFPQKQIGGPITNDRWVMVLKSYYDVQVSKWIRAHSLPEDWHQRVSKLSFNVYTEAFYAKIQSIKIVNNSNGRRTSAYYLYRGKTFDRKIFFDGKMYYRYSSNSCYGRNGGFEITKVSAKNNSYIPDSDSTAKLNTDLINGNLLPEPSRFTKDWVDSKGRGFEIERTSDSCYIPFPDNWSDIIHNISPLSLHL